MPQGVSFQCRRCGACCRVPGDVALAPDEAQAIADFLGLDVYVFTARYTALAQNRRDLTLVEQSDGRCVFLQPDGSCRVQPVKPVQCKGFPTVWRSPRLTSVCAALRAGGGG